MGSRFFLLNKPRLQNPVNQMTDFVCKNSFFNSGIDKVVMVRNALLPISL